MKIKRIILSTIFVAGLIISSTSCSQTDEMDHGDSGGKPVTTPSGEKSTEYPAKTDSISHSDFVVD